MDAWKYEIYFSCLSRISHSFASLTREISCSILEINFIYISAQPCNILYMIEVDISVGVRAEGSARFLIFNM